MTPQKTTKNKRAELAQEPKPKKQQKERIGLRFYEAGSSGLKENYGFITEAYNSALYWPTVQPLYARIRRSTPEIVSIRHGFTTWGRNIKPIVNLPDNFTSADEKYQDYLYSEFENWDGGFGQLIDTMVNYIPFMGWGFWEAPPAIRDPEWKPPNSDEWRSEADDGLLGIRRFAWRDSSTFNGWIKDDKSKKVIGLKQQDFPHQAVELFFKDGLHLTFGDPDNPEGLSPLEAVWRLERLKYGYEVVMGIGSEHAAGHLKIMRTEEGTSSGADKTAIETAARNLLSAQQGNFGYFPKGLDGTVMDVPFAAGNFLLETIKYYSTMIYMVYMMQFVALNTMTQTGAMASQVDSTDMAVFSFNAMMDGFASQFDNQIGKRLFEWNKASFPGIKRPKITFSHIDKSIALGELGSFLTQVDGIINLGDDDLKAIRKRSGFLAENEPNPEDIIKSAIETRKLDQKSKSPEEKEELDKEEETVKKEMAELG
jgi:hypothetical protein